MFELRVERTFCAAHAVRIHGELEPTHGHNWSVAVVVSSPRLDENDLVCDFHLIERRLDEVLAPLHNADLNRTPPFDAVSPTAERVAKYIHESLSERLPPTVELARVTVGEAPGCFATYSA